jgi:hypothetical protein
MREPRTCVSSTVADIREIMRLGDLLVLRDLGEGRLEGTAGFSKVRSQNQIAIVIVCQPALPTSYT